MASRVKQSGYFDIIIAGAGLAGLSLLYRAMQAGTWNDLKILVLDVPIAEKPDRTWSFWAKGPGPFDPIVCKQWANLLFVTHKGRKIPLHLNGYTYNSILSSDFHAFTLAYLSDCTNVTFSYEEVLSMETAVDHCTVQTALAYYTSKYVFNAIYKKPSLKTGEQYFLQHFKGLMIKTGRHQFDPDEASLMDFRTGQEHGTSFFYALPFKDNELFVEYTVFSKAVLDQAAYDKKIKEYIENVLKVASYEVTKTEYGVIPMTDHVFPRFNGNIVNIGSAGGDTRGATGYTYSNVQKTVEKILQSWTETQTPFFKVENVGIKHQLYDGTLLRVLDAGQYKGHQIFEDLFSRTKADRVFSFLDAETNIIADLSIITSLRPMPFLKAMTSVLAGKIIH
jgi:lycopene beta-cyclase